MQEELPYAGLKVVDASQGVAGPHCGMLMALNGADVVKIEPPEGDWGRAIGRQYGDFSAYGAAFNRGKRSIALDLKQPGGLAVARRVMLEADVVIENYRPGVLARFGLDYPTLAPQRPELVYVSVTGFGQSGPRSRMPATDSILQSFSGLMSVNRDEAGTPQRVGVLVIDVVTGLYAFQAIGTALYRRVTRGGGRHISVSLMESIGAVQAGKMIEYHLEGDQGKKPGVPVATFRTVDGYLTINARRDQHFAALARLLGRAELGTDPRFAGSAARAEHEGELMPELRALIASWETDALAAALAEADVLHAPVNDYARYFEDEHVTSTGAIAWVEHPEMGRIPLPAIPGLGPVASGDPHASSPGIGQHSQAILEGLGYAGSEIAALAGSGAVVLARRGQAAD